MSLVYVVAKITGTDETKDKLAEALAGVVPTVRQEEGCLRYDLHRSAKGEPVFLFYEIWQSKEALAAHAKAPHMAAMQGQIKELVAGPSEITLWEAVEVA
ncbi:MAG: antibiotic biosynthesis monooxygenase [Desulfarculaceae bacterium]|nr:antibiotic biosynthesis monooxygenase [Desulfarculaceae bacterium]